MSRLTDHGGNCGEEGRPAAPKRGQMTTEYFHG